MKSNDSVQISGSGRPVLFLHGFLESNQMWRELTFSSLDIQSIYIHLNGHGELAKQAYKKIHSIKQLAKEIFEKLKPLNLESYDCVGHSLGGYVALELAKLDVRLNKLVLFHSNHWEDTEEKKKNRNRVAKIVAANFNLFLHEAIPNLFYEPTSYTQEIKSLIKNAQTIAPQTVIDCSLAMRDRLDNDEFVCENRERCYLIQGALDKTMDTEVARKKWKGEKIHFFEVENCSHMGHFEQKEIIENLLSKIILT
jgi:pimeloyl-ACP methyl ester carboxylesterase